jgi:hypothetical protein
LAIKILLVNSQGLTLSPYDPEPLLVEEGKLPGKIKEDSIVLGGLNSEQLKLITSGRTGVLFEWDEPVIFMRKGD